MRKSLKCAALVAVAAALVAVAMVPEVLAQTTPAPADRYMVSPIEGGILRVDRQNGRVSVCRQVNSDWTCKLVPDDFRALKREIDQLSVENLRLRSALTKYDPEAAKQPKPRRERRSTEMPTEEEIDRAVGLFDKMIRRFMDTARALRRDYDTPSN
ncbi:MAG: hypothetical protein ACTSY1_02050 [Alphaproteobacteria bacterium]